VRAVLLRHASAGDPSDWDADDRLRPLDPRGLRQAAALADLLRALPVERVVSSPYRRCVQTVEPLAAAIGLGVEHDDRLAEGAGDAARTLLVEAGIVACTHGDVVEQLLGHGLMKGAAVLLEDGRVVGEVRPPED
jgi:phosphohistidine phosphatase SixA